MNKTEKRLREKIKSLEAELHKVKEDRHKYRHYFVQNFRCSVDLLGKNETWNMIYVVKTLSEQMTKFESFYWGVF